MTRTSFISPATSSPATASRAACWPTTSARPTAASRTFSTQLQSPAGKVRLPAETLILDRYGLARELSLPFDGDRYQNELLYSYRLGNGVLHNPTNDRRTTQGVFHVAEGGLPIPADKIAVPLRVLRSLLHEALDPPAELLRLPFTRELEAAGGDHGVAAAPPAGLPGGAGGVAREAHGGPVLRARRAGVATSTSSRASSATPAIRTCPRTTPASTSTTGPATPAA